MTDLDIKQGNRAIKAWIDWSNNPKPKIMKKSLKEKTHLFLLDIYYYICGNFLLASIGIFLLSFIGAMIMIVIIIFIWAIALSF